MYSFKDLVDIPPLEFCDDIFFVSECEVRVVQVNAAVNVKVESKKLSLGKDKCLKMIIRKKSRTGQKDQRESCYSFMF